ncbi:MAG: hypothetical protein WB615_09465 [Candidatus Tumulicola sp.]
MHSTQRALRWCLVAVAGALAAAVAHVVIDVAGDYLLARDAYDGIAHHSRALLLAIVGVTLLAGAVKAIFDILDRRCSSTTSTLAAVRDALGNPLRFALASAAVAIVALVAMESFDCLLSGRIEDVGDLFGGSVALGAGTAAFAGALCGALVHRVVRFVARYEAPIAAFIVAVFNLKAISESLPRAQRRFGASRTVNRALLLSRQERKRGPPCPVSG